MKKTGLLPILALAVCAVAQQPNPAAVGMPSFTQPEGTSPSVETFPMERIQTPTKADLYCAGMVTRQLLPNANFVAGGLNTPNTSQFARGDIVYLQGKGYQLGQRYMLVRELKDPNEYELFAGQHRMLRQMGQPYAELAYAQVVDTRSRMAVARIEFGCSPVVPGDIAVPLEEAPEFSFHLPMHFDRFAPASNKVSGRIVVAKDFDSELGTGSKVYLNVGANQGVKVGDYMRAVRQYEADLHDPVDSLSFKASISEDTQMKVPSIDSNMFTKNNGPAIHMRDLPRRAVGEILILKTTPTTSTGMLVFAMEDVLVGAQVEMDEQQ